MKTTADQDDILYELIAPSGLAGVINGGVYKGERPLNSKKEDIVILSMLLGDGTLQQGVANVNIYIPKLKVSVDGVSQEIRNSKRIKEVLNEAKLVLKEHYGPFYSMYTSRQQEFDEAEIKQTRLNFRIEFRLDDTL